MKSTNGASNALGKQKIDIHIDYRFAADRTQFFPVGGVISFMKELKCPKCGNVFSVDEADYAFIANQVKTEEFNAEVNRRMEELHKQHQAEQQLEESKLDRVLAENKIKHQKELN